MVFGTLVGGPTLSPDAVSHRERGAGPVLGETGKMLHSLVLVPNPLPGPRPGQSPCLPWKGRQKTLVGGPTLSPDAVMGPGLTRGFLVPGGRESCLQPRVLPIRPGGPSPLPPVRRRGLHVENSDPGVAEPAGTFRRPWRPNGGRHPVGVCGRRSGEVSSTRGVILAALGFSRASPGRYSQLFAKARWDSSAPGGHTERPWTTSL